MQESFRHEAGGKKVASEKKPRPNGVWRMDAEGHGVSHQDRIHTAGKPKEIENPGMKKGFQGEDQPEKGAL